jgi:flagellar hook protein FlgE
MASLTALMTGLTGLNANARSIDVVGNNIANANTTAFKSSRAEFANLFSRTISGGTPPEETTGGTNPYQIGFGVNVTGVKRSFNNGTISATGEARDLAIDGDGFFIADRGGEQLFTRAGAFVQNEQNELTTLGGERIMGFGVDESFQVREGALEPVRIPLGGLTLAEASTRVRFSGNLNANGVVPTRGSQVEIGGTATEGLRAIATAVPPPGAGNRVEAGTRLLDLEDPLLPGTNTALFTAGQSIELRGAEKGTKIMPTQRLPIDATTTLGQLTEFLAQSLGIDATGGANPDGRTPGVTIDAATGRINIVGNVGTVNDLEIQATDLRVLNADGSFARAPLTTSKQAAADGESVRTTFVVYDSLGAPVEAELAFVLESKSDAGTTWRYFAESSDDSDASPVLGTGVVGFNPDGQLNTSTPIEVTIDRGDSGAVTPLALSFELSGGADNVTALADTRSQIVASFRDGAPIGTLSGFSFGTDGTISGTFTNGQVRTLGRVALARFNNNEGLVDRGGNMWAVGPNSGAAQITTPGTLGAGSLVGGSLELSNVDIGQEFIRMIVASTGYSAASRVVRTADELIQQLLVLGR